ncbi:MAG TPA: low temperature requirement protein A, partial [Candidatus Thermoplasmatota archaeon]|nr:low temperature requirement protein A [Candidatus Thermoplasmatota archaeon]
MPAGWWRPPRLRSNEPDEHRRATWLELFYDLVYVVAVAALAARLEARHDAAGWLEFAALFVPVWWSWAGVTFYNDRFDTDDLAHRLLTLLLMVGAVGLAIFIEHGVERGGAGFALSYVGLRAILVFMYLRAGRHATIARPLTRRYALGFSIAAAMWLASLAVDPPLRHVVWALAMAVDVGTPLTARRHQAMLPISRSHLPERIGLFTIIVLGEGVAAVVHGAGAGAIGVSTLAAAALALSIGFAVWWVYFENLDETVVRRTRVAGQVWFYAHLPLAVSITAAAVGLHAVVAHPGSPLSASERWLLGGSVAGAF